MMAKITDKRISTLYQNNDIRIRPYGNEDVTAMLDCIQHSIVEMQPFLPWVHANYSRDDAEQWVRSAQQIWGSGLQYDFVIERKVDNHFLGGVGLLNVDLKVKTANLGYWLDSRETGKSYTTEAAKLAMQFAQQELGLERLIIYMSTDNSASQKIAEKLGATFIETRLNYETIHDRCLDCHVYELTLKAKPKLAIFL